jgi:hypothetical protein
LTLHAGTTVHNKEGIVVQQRLGNLIGGLLLIALGMLFLLFQFIPGLDNFFRIDLFWPLIIIGVGAAFLVAAVAARTPPLAIPGSIIGGIGCLLFIQNLTGYWESWAFAWTFIPGFVGVGLALNGLLSGKATEGLRAGGILIAISFILFVIFATFLGPFSFLRQLWPLLLVLAGLALLGRTLLARR